MGSFQPSSLLLLVVGVAGPASRKPAHPPLGGLPAAAGPPRWPRRPVLLRLPSSEAKELQPRGLPRARSGSALSGAARPRGQYFGGRGNLNGNENKPLTALSNRNSNDSRKLATPSEPITSNFLIATKLHVSEEKAKREEKANLVEASKTIVLGMHG
jgi:hypothetical protein